MHYRYGTKEQFDATKASLKIPAAGASSSPRPLYDAMNYGAHLPGFRTKVKFRSKRGENLRTGTAPLCAHEPEKIVRAPLNAAQENTDDASDEPTGAFMAAPATAGGFPFLDEAPAAAQDKPKISTPAISGLLGVAGAIIVGIVIASGSSFQLKASTVDPGAATSLHGASGPITEPAALVPGRLSLDRTPPQTSNVNQVASQRENPAPAPAAAPAIAAGQPKETAPLVPALPPMGASGAPKAQTAETTPPESVKPARQSSKLAGATAKPNPGNAVRTVKKKPRSSSTEAPRRSTPSSAPYSDREPSYTAEAGPSRRVRYARCEQVSGLFRREQCRWRACDGKWGQDGCPAYKQQRSNPMVGAMFADESLQRWIFKSPNLLITPNHT